jgi:signal transduction histidine kinase
MAHELRTPLTVIQGQLEAIADGVYPADEAHLAPIAEQARTLDRLVEDLRTVALAEAGALELRREPVDLAALTDDVVTSFPWEGRAITTRPAKDLPLADVDPARIRQVLVNLLTNAVRHTAEAGQITVTVERDLEHALLAVSVSDDGEGIAPDLLPSVFDRFARSPDSPGTGLGLAIARDLVVAHGGTITAESVPGQGTTMRFTLPAVPAGGRD